MAEMLKPSIAKLSVEHDPSALDCGHQALNAFIRSHALPGQRAQISQTYVAAVGTTIVGYHTLAVGDVSYGDAPERLTKDLAANNFPKSGEFGDGAVVPTRKMIIEDDPHRVEEIRRALFSGCVDRSQNVHRHRQAFGRSRLLHELLGDGDRVKHHALAGARDVWKQPMFDGVVFGALRRVMRDADFQFQPICQFFQRFLEHMPVGGIAAAAIAQQ
jgi:hypothetical protein